MNDVVIDVTTYKRKGAAMTAPAIDVNDLTFGIEIETAMPRGVVNSSGIKSTASCA